jgi:hypothetical protein
MSARGRVQVGMRDGHYGFSKLSSCLPAHRRERKGSGGEKHARLEFEPVRSWIEHKRTDLRSISLYCSP